jgi:diguanylate cyclase (GGDEF)-like protein
MSDFLRDPAWLRRASTWALRLGPWGATVALTAATTVAAMPVALVVALATGTAWPAALAVAAACTLALTPPIGGLIVRLMFKVEAARRQLTMQATHDPLTGLQNRRHFLALAEREWARCQRYGTDGALLLIDADHFKSINDTHGRACGDALLRDIARVTAQTLRPSDLLARLVGEELAVFLPHTDPLGALDAAERIRVQLGDLRLDWQGAQVGTTVSIGVASVNTTQPSLDALIQDADMALYAAKQSGRNCVRSAPVLPRGSAARGSSVGDRRAAGPV